MNMDLLNMETEKNQSGEHHKIVRGFPDLPFEVAGFTVRSFPDLPFEVFRICRSKLTGFSVRGDPDYAALSKSR